MLSWGGIEGVSVAMKDLSRPKQEEEVIRLLREVCNSWVNGRKVIDGIPLELRKKVEKTPVKEP
jgi:hypothetical protein